MIFALIGCDLGFILRLVRRMGCFFGCFRVKDDNRPQPHLISDAVSSKSRQDSSVSRNKLASLLLSEDKESSPCEDAVHHTLGSTLLGVYGDGEVKELKDEAKFLKACGTLLETPAEIRKVSEKGKDSHDGDSEPSRFYSWLPSTSIKKLHWEEQPDQAPVSPVKLSEELGKESGSLVHKPSSCMSKGEKMAGSNYIRATEGSDYESPDTEIKKPLDPISNEKFSSVTPELLTVNTQSRNKCVRFECESDMGLFPSNGESLKQFDSPGSRNGSERSPYPTPLNLTDEMQTPGTIYPANLENIANGKNARIRSQYVYPVFNPVENFSQWKALKEEDSNPFQQLGHPRESLEQSEHASPQRTSVSYSGKSQMMGENIFGKELKVDASLAHWVKPPSSPKDDRNQNTGARATSSGKSSKMSDGDRPILGMVAAHWNDEDTSRISPKWWDGNGIPNSTNKYKEDQRVSWHATPFEERLEKALSEESHVYQRKNLNEIPIDFEGNEESDTAISRLQSSAHPESVVSF